MNKIESLSILTTETLLSVEHCQFKDLAMALPSVESASESIDEVEFIGRNDDYIEVSEKLRIEPDTEERMIVTDKYIVAGGLCFDQDAPNPLEDGCGNGHIYHRGRRGDRDQESAFYEAVGMDGDGNSDLSLDAVLQHLIDNAISAMRKNRSLMTSLGNLLRHRGFNSRWGTIESLVSDAATYAGWEDILDRIAYTLFGEWRFANIDQKWQDRLSAIGELFSEEEAQKSWEHLSRTGKIGHPMAVMIDIYEHGGISYSVSGHGMQCRFDTTSGGAIWVPCKEAESNIRSRVAEEICSGKVEWFGSLGVDHDLLNARYSLDDGQTWIGEGMGWKWDEAVDAMQKAAEKNISPAELQSMLYAESEKYCASILDTYTSWANGDVYGVCYYVIDRETGERIDDHDEECWGFIGGEYAEEELERGMLSIAADLGKTIQ